MVDLQKIKITCKYHTKDECVFDIHARDVEDAKEIAKKMFKEKFTDRCHLDEVTSYTDKK